MNGISSKAISFGQKNSRKFNGGSELDETFDINYYETFFRHYDAQVGRFTGLDIRAEEGFDFSPYNFALDNPISLNDPMGDKETLPVYIPGSNGMYRTAQGRVIGWGELQQYLREQGKLSDSWSAGGGGSDGHIYSFGFGISRKTGNEGFRILYSFIKSGGEEQHVGLGNVFLSYENFHDVGNSLEAYYKRQENFTIWCNSLGIYGVSGAVGENILYSRITNTGAGWYLNKSLNFEKIQKGISPLNADAAASRLLAKNISKITKPLGVLTTGISAFQTIDDLQNGNYESATVHGGDTIMGVVAFWGPVGAGLSGLYFLSRFFWGD